MSKGWVSVGRELQEVPSVWGFSLGSGSCWGGDLCGMSRCVLWCQYRVSAAHQGCVAYQGCPQQRIKAVWGRALGYQLRHCTAFQVHIATSRSRCCKRGQGEACGAHAHLRVEGQTIPASAGCPAPYQKRSNQGSPSVPTPNNNIHARAKPGVQYGFTVSYHRGEQILPTRPTNSR